MFAPRPMPLEGDGLQGDFSASTVLNACTAAQGSHCRPLNRTGLSGWRRLEGTSRRIGNDQRRSGFDRL